MSLEKVFELKKLEHNPFYDMKHCCCIGSARYQLQTRLSIYLSFYKYSFLLKKVEKRSNNMKTISGFEVIYGLYLTPLR